MSIFNLLDATLGLYWPLKMIGKGFVLFKINSSPSAFYIIKPTCISWLVFKVNKCLKKSSKTAQPERLFMLPIDDVIQWRKQTSSLFVFFIMALNLIFGTLSAEFKFNNNVERWNLQSSFIHGRITAAAGLWHNVRSTNSAGAAGNSHF